MDSSPIDAGHEYGSRFPDIKSIEVDIIVYEPVPDLNTIYHNSEFGRHYLGARGTGFLIANDFGHNYMAGKLTYAGQTDTLLIFAIEGAGGKQHAYDKNPTEDLFGVWYRALPTLPFRFWFYAHQEDNVLGSPT